MHTVTGPLFGRISDAGCGEQTVERDEYVCKLACQFAGYLNFAVEVGTELG